MCGVCGGDGTNCDDCAGGHAAMYCSTDGTSAGATGATAAMDAATGRWACAAGAPVYSTPGASYVDECGTCDADPANDCPMDCQVG